MKRTKIPASTGKFAGIRRVFEASAVLLPALTLANEIPAGKNSFWSCMVTSTCKRDMTLALSIRLPRQQSKTVSELSFLTTVHTAKGDRHARGNNRDFCLHRYDTMADPDYSSSSGWLYFNGVSMTTPPATAAEAPGSPCDATIRRPQRLSSGLDHRNRIGHVHVVGMKTKR